MSKVIADEPIAMARRDDDVAIRVENVSKYFGLWSSPSARLKLPILSALRRASPSAAATRMIENKIGGIYRAFPALQKVSLEIKKGESWGVIGVNGSGKSTLLKMIAGNLRPSSGRIEVDGKVAILDYSSGLHGAFTGRENVYLKAALHGMSRREIDEKFDAVASFADIGEFIDQPVKTYSSGMIGRLGFAIMAHVDADIIITDEALAVGDAFFVQKCMNFIRSFLKRGTFLFVSHSTNDVVSLCEKAVWLDHGQVRNVGDAKEVTDAYLSSRTLSRAQEYFDRNKVKNAPLSQEAPGQTRSSEDDAHELRQPRLNELMDAKTPRVIRDSRVQFLNYSQWRNDIQIPEFSMEFDGFGVGGAHIENVMFEDDNGTSLSWIVGGEMVRLKIAVRAGRDMQSPMVGFQVRDRLGQVLFADNTYLITVEKPFNVIAGQLFQAEFCFQMPMMPVGDYAIRVACALGVESDNAMLHCINAALVFSSTTSGSRHGLVGVPMQSIRISLSSDEAKQVDQMDMFGILQTKTPV